MQRIPPPDDSYNSVASQRHSRIKRFRRGLSKAGRRCLVRLAATFEQAGQALAYALHAFGAGLLRRAAIEWRLGVVLQDKLDRFRHFLARQLGREREAK